MFVSSKRPTLSATVWNTSVVSDDTASMTAPFCGFAAAQSNATPLMRVSGMGPPVENTTRMAESRPLLAKS